MKIKRLKFVDKIRNVNNEHIDVLVDKGNCYKYLIDVETSQNLFEEMNQEKLTILDSVRLRLS